MYIYKKNSMNLKELKLLNEKLQEHLEGKDYSFIAPIDGTLYGEYIKETKRYPSNKIHSILSNTQIANEITNKYSNEELTIYVIPEPHDNTMILFDTFDNYCKTRDIKL